MGGLWLRTAPPIRRDRVRCSAMVVGEGLMVGFGGFAAGAACVWLRVGRIRGELHRMRFAAEHDCLTGLPNRAGIRRCFEQMRAKGRGPTLALLDLDGFKQVNDTFGHHAGDLFLVGVAARLDGGCRGVAPVGRLGGDEFLILLSEPAGQEAAAKVEVVLHRLAEPIAVGEGIDLVAKASVGIATATAECTWSSQLRRADIALYHAKNGPSGTVVFRDGMQHPTGSSPDRRHRGIQPGAVIGPGLESQLSR